MKKICLSVFACLLFLSGCTNNASNNNQNKENNEKITVDATGKKDTKKSTTYSSPEQAPYTSSKPYNYKTPKDIVNYVGFYSAKDIISNSNYLLAINKDGTYNISIEKNAPSDEDGFKIYFDKTNNIHEVNKSKFLKTGFVKEDSDGSLSLFFQNSLSLEQPFLDETGSFLPIFKQSIIEPDVVLKSNKITGYSQIENTSNKSPFEFSKLNSQPEQLKFSAFQINSFSEGLNIESDYKFKNFNEFAQALSYPVKVDSEDISTTNYSSKYLKNFTFKPINGFSKIKESGVKLKYIISGKSNNALGVSNIGYDGKGLFSINEDGSIVNPIYYKNMILPIKSFIPYTVIK